MERLGLDRYYSTGEDGYFSLFYSSRNAQKIVAPQNFCNFLFVIMLSIKFADDSIPWMGVFSVLFVSDLLSFIVKIQELTIVAHLADVFGKFVRQMAALIDLAGSATGKIILCYFLSNKAPFTFNVTGRHLFTILLLPHWLGMVISAILRITVFSCSTEVSAQFARYKIFGIVLSIISFVIRGVQLLLVTMRIDGMLAAHWAIIFSPSWAIIFFSLGCTTLLLSFAPFIHANANTQLRETAITLAYIVAALTTTVAVCSLIFVILLSQKLDYLSNLSEQRQRLNKSTSNNDIDTFYIMTPMIVMFGCLMILNPLFIVYSTKYQVIILAAHDLCAVLLTDIFY